MIKTNYHSHSRFCDGEGSLENYVLSALESCMKALGFSGHAPLPFPIAWTIDDEEVPRYIGESRRLGELYGEKIELYTGMEIDYLDDDWNPAHPGWDELDLDFRIGSIHLLQDPKDGKYYGVDGPEEEVRHLVDAVYGGRPAEMVTAYYRRLQHMVRKGGFDIIGHLDLVKKLNSRLSLFSEGEEWYRRLIAEVVDTIAESGLILEVNTGGISRGYIAEPYPSPWILKMCKEREIPITLNSDAHRAPWIDYWYEEAVEIIRAAGYRYAVALLQGEWREIPI